MMDALPQQPHIVVVENATTHAPTFLFGFMGVGDEQAMSALEKAAMRLGFPADRTKNDKEETEVMVLFPAGSDSTRALSLYRDASAGAFGQLRLEVVIAPGSAASDGKIDMESEVSVEPPHTISIPKP
jgi:hypothetical protein